MQLPLKKRHSDLIASINTSLMLFFSVAWDKRNDISQFIADRLGIVFGGLSHREIGHAKIRTFGTRYAHRIQRDSAKERTLKILKTQGAEEAKYQTPRER